MSAQATGTVYSDHELIQPEREANTEEPGAAGSDLRKS